MQECLVVVVQWVNYVFVGISDQNIYAAVI